MKTCETLQRWYLGVIDTDVIAGWETGLKRKQRLCGHLRPRLPPSHITGDRYLNWCAGRDATYKYRATWRTLIVAGDLHIRRKGFVTPQPVINRLEKDGITGDVYIYYLKDGDTVRTINQGI